MWQTYLGVGERASNRSSASGKPILELERELQTGLQHLANLSWSWRESFKQVFSIWQTYLGVGERASNRSSASDKPILELERELRTGLQHLTNLSWSWRESFERVFSIWQTYLGVGERTSNRSSACGKPILELERELQTGLQHVANLSWSWRESFKQVFSI